MSYQDQIILNLEFGFQPNYHSDKELIIQDTFSDNNVRTTEINKSLVKKNINHSGILK